MQWLSAFHPARLKVVVPKSTAIRFVSFAMVFVTVMAAGAVAYFTQQGIVNGRDSVIHTYRVRSLLSDLQIEIMRARDSEMNSLLTRDEGEMPLSREEAQLAAQMIGELRQLLRNNPTQQPRLEQLDALLKERKSSVDSHASSGVQVSLSPSARTQQRQSEHRQMAISSIIDTMQQEQESLLEHRLRAWNYLFRRNVVMLGLAFAIMSIMLVYHFRMLIAEVARTKDMERQVRDNAQSYRVMSARILELQDSERRRIARELHDSIGQFLAGLKINLDQLGAGPRVDSDRLIHETIKLTDCALQEVRTLSHLLHPPLLEELGFFSAARWYLDEYGKRSQIRVSLEVDPPVERLPREIEMALFRVLQESLTNVYRHAGAQSVKVRIACRQGIVSLIVADDGKGIPQEVLAKFQRGAAPGIGLAGMRERLAEFGGEIKVASSRSGSVIEATIPIKDSPTAQRRAG